MVDLPLIMLMIDYCLLCSHLDLEIMLIEVTMLTHQINNQIKSTLKIASKLDYKKYLHGSI